MIENIHFIILIISFPVILLLTITWYLYLLILKYVVDKALERGIADTLKHLILIEDSQLLIPSVLREVLETSLVEDIPLLLRGVGESLITIATRPKISADIISSLKNSSTSLMIKFKLDN